MKLKQSVPAGMTGRENKKHTNWIEREYKHSLAMPQVCCEDCAFYELIIRKRVYSLCHLTGEREPSPEDNGCCFIRGTLEELDEILGLPNGAASGKVNFPNVDRPSDSLIHAQHGENNGHFVLISHSYADNRHEYKMAARRPVSARTGGLSTTGERIAAFCILKP